MSDTVAACPYCDAPNVHMNSPGGHNAESDSGRFRCSSCKRQFERPKTRERKEGVAPGHKRRGLAGRLEDATPDEVSR